MGDAATRALDQRQRIRLGMAGVAPALRCQGPDGWQPDRGPRVWLDRVVGPVCEPSSLIAAGRGFAWVEDVAVQQPHRTMQRRPGAVTSP